MIDCLGGGRIVTMGFPGLEPDVSGGAYIDPERRSETLDHPALARCAVLIALVEEGDVPEGALEGLGEALARRDIVLEHAPIADYAAPSGAFEAQWSAKAPGFQALLDAGRTIGICCHYGAGRSGTIAARLLIERGLTSAEAIARVREAFPESIESKAQLDWLKAYAPAAR